ncbi:MAG: restriction endonuclease subunit S [Oscillospiraceae bacterium]|nr:restriction endonuclease subunit S [Oscillospiraceae bacterium]
MKFEWKTYTFEEVCNKIYSGGTPSTKHSEYWNGNINWLSSGETSSRYIYKTEKKITQLGVEKSSTKKAFEGSTIVASAGQGHTRGQASYLMIDTYVNQSIIVFEPNTNIIDNKYLYYNIDGRYEELRQLSDGTSTRGGLSGWIVKRMQINLPNLSTQYRISSILSVLDDKIELNNKINQNLEQQAQAIYHFMFLSTSQTTDKIGLLSELITIKYGKDHKKLNDGVYPVYGSGGIIRYVEKPLYHKESVLIPRKGSLNNILYVESPFWVVDTMFFTEMKMPNIAKFVFHCMKSKNLVSLNTGSAVPSMTTAILNSMKIKIPSVERLEKFEKLVTPMYKKIKENMYQSEYLANLRDALLPKLMKGEIDVSKIKI